MLVELGIPMLVELNVVVENVVELVFVERTTVLVPFVVMEVGTELVPLGRVVVRLENGLENVVVPLPSC